MLCRAVPRSFGAHLNTISVRRNSTTHSSTKCSPELCSKSCAMSSSKESRHWTTDNPLISGKTLEKLTCLHNVPPSGANPKAVNLIVEASLVKAELERTQLDYIADNIKVGTLGVLTVGAVTSAILTTGLTAGLSLGVAVYCGGVTYRSACETEETKYHEKKHLLTAKLYQLERLLRRT